MKAFAPDPKPERKEEKKDVSNSIEMSIAGMYIWAIYHLTFWFFANLKDSSSPYKLYPNQSKKRYGDLAARKIIISQAINRQVPNA